MQFSIATEGQAPLKHSADENSTEKPCPRFKDIVRNLIATEHIYIDISANSTLTSVEYSHLHVPCPHGCFFL